MAGPERGRPPERIAARRDAHSVCANLYIRMVRFEWDERKNQSNLVKHGVDFHTAQLIFDDPGCITFIERTKDGEPRWHAIGFVVELFCWLPYTAIAMPERTSSSA